MLDWIWSKVFDQIVVSDVAVREGGQIAPAIRKDSPLLHALLSEFRLSHGRGTLFGNVLINRYYSQSWWLRDATSTAERRKFDAVVDLFRKYSAEYDFDYLMMIALGYQESMLEPDARSHVGAIGIMQVMPATAAGPPIFMDNVESPDDNIRAGIMYMRHLVDRFFNDPAIDEVNRHLIAFAAYNAGPTRVSRLRRRAPEYGLDPNVWFRNVERIVASNVGREPVRYVGNIYKYYLAFRRVREMQGEGGGN
jgi:membrane-bound lytic murein transglycosylase MltF